ncbi:MAG: hypothetical protein ACK4TA_12790 [Saprospiraceae bacterium]
MKIIYTIFFIFSGLYTFAQSSASLYSAYGIGNIYSPAVGILDGLGGAGIGLRSPHFVNTVNPAANVFMQAPATMMLDAGLYTEAAYARNNEARSLQGGGGLSHLVLWLQPNKYWGTTLGLMPFSEVNYNIKADRYNEILSANYDVTYQGSGGLNRLFWSNAFQPLKNVSVGVNLSFLFGSIERAENFITNADLDAFSTITKTNFADVLVDLGLQYGFRIHGNQLVLGATFQPGSKVASAENSELRRANGEVLTAETQSDDIYQLPLRAGLGISWNAKRLLLSSDITFEQWSTTQLNTDNDLHNTVKCALGAEWSLAERSYLFYQKPLLLRTGFFIQNHHQTVEGNTFPLWGFSVGASLPIRRKLHHLSMNYSFRQRGTKNDDLLLESIHRFTLNINLRDIWFQKKRFN